MLEAIAGWLIRDPIRINAFDFAVGGRGAKRWILRCHGHSFPCHMLCCPWMGDPRSGEERLKRVFLEGHLQATY